MREEVTGKFDGKTLEAAFGNIEVFFSIFPKDEPIKEASIELVVSILKAVEDAIGFFISKQSEFTARSPRGYMNTKLKFCQLQGLRQSYCEGMITKRNSLEALVRSTKTAGR